uniref:Biogenesis of lysosome-related organelles complex 1 subunit 7 n=1 Tax=Meloidogyne incognita TaxID=6306 RepID=A0A914MPD2_MELIC
MASKSSASFQVIEEGEEQKEEQQPSISSSNADEQPPVIAIMEMIRPAVQNLDNQVKCTRKSQIMLASHIDELSKKLKSIVDEQTLPYDLDIYVRKLEDSRKRMTSVNQRLQNQKF